MASRSIIITGDKELIAKFKRYQSKAPHAFGAALFQEGEGVMADAAENFVPVDTGALKGSGHVQPPQIKGYSIIVKLGFGGAAAKYALYVHERLGVRHPIGQAKYLETPLMKAADTMPQRLAKRIKEFLIKG